MKERPIPFSGDEVRAILDGRKTQRRPVVRDILACHYGKPGDRLWVRETWCPVDDTTYGGTQWIDYRSTPKYGAEHPAGWENAPDDPEALKWRPSTHMPRWASRITLEITEVRVQRVRDIREEDAAAEGADGEEMCNLRGATWLSHRQGFRNLWDSINGKRPGCSWGDNPWVWAITFKRVEIGGAV